MIATEHINGKCSLASKAIVACRRWSKLLCSVILLSSVFGCAAAYNSRHDLSPDKRHSVDCYIRGAFGRNYYRETEKKIEISIYSHGPNDQALLKQDFDEQEKDHPGYQESHQIPGLEAKLLLAKEYHIKGSDISWRSVWESQNNLSIIFYDYGANVAFYGSPAQAPPERTLLRVNFSFDASVGTYKEETGSEH